MKLSLKVVGEGDLRDDHEVSEATSAPIGAATAGIGMRSDSEAAVRGGSVSPGT